MLLPCSQAEGPTASAPTALTKASHGEGTVLVVDDDEPMLRLTGLFLEEAGFSVRPALGGRAALGLLEREIEQIDAAVLDLAMPEVGGPEVLAHIRERRPELPVLLVSGYGQEAAAPHVTAESHTAFLHKPYEPEELVGLLGRLLGAASG